MRNETSKPVEEIRLGAIKAAIWKNVVDQGNNSRAIFNVSFQCLYRDSEGKWQSSDSFGRDDLLVLANVADQRTRAFAGYSRRNALDPQNDRRQDPAEQQEMRMAERLQGAWRRHLALRWGMASINSIRQMQL